MPTNMRERQSDRKLSVPADNKTTGLKCRVTRPTSEVRSVVGRQVEVAWHRTLGKHKRDQNGCNSATAVESAIVTDPAKAPRGFCDQEGLCELYFAKYAVWNIKTNVQRGGPICEVRICFFRHIAGIREIVSKCHNVCQRCMEYSIFFWRFVALHCCWG